MFEIQNLPKELYERHNATLTNGILRGVEREALRTDLEGGFAHTPHPRELGSALTHPLITTDFSEALLEFITQPTHRLTELFNQLDNIHRYAAGQLQDELLWTSSMPCKLPNEEDIPVAQYGDSHNGKMKSVYRVGLGHRYGRAMQTVAGIHYNFSLPNTFWAHFHAKEHSLLSLEAYKDQRYFALIRNFRRYYWLLILLFGASPAMCSSFVGAREHNLQSFGDSQALYLPHATSLRMGDLGYQSHLQESLFVCYNHKHTYIKTLANAILKPHPHYSGLATKDATGQYTQLNQGLLQIENEFYSAIRPKRSAKPGETALTALHNRGVEYIEVRCLDINPFSPLGITEEQVSFLDTFLLYCALLDSPNADDEEFQLIQKNQKAVVNRGRQPDLKLDSKLYGKLSVKEWGLALLDAMQPAADILDASYEKDRYNKALTAQRDCLNDMSLTPSAKILDELSDTGEHYPEFALRKAKENNAALKQHTLSPSELEGFSQLASKSIDEQQAIESRSTGSFDQFLSDYYRQYEKVL